MGKHEGKRPLGRPINGKIILRLIFMKWDVGTSPESMCLRIGTGDWNL